MTRARRRREERGTEGRRRRQRLREAEKRRRSHRNGRLTRREKVKAARKNFFVKMFNHRVRYRKTQFGWRPMAGHMFLVVR